MEFALNSVFEIKEKFGMVKKKSTAIAEQFSVQPEDFNLSECFKLFGGYFRKITWVSMVSCITSF